MTFLVLISPGGDVPPGLISCELCGQSSVQRTAGTVNGTARHREPENGARCFGPVVTEKHAAAKIT